MKLTRFVMGALLGWVAGHAAAQAVPAEVAGRYQGEIAGSITPGSALLQTTISFDFQQDGSISGTSTTGCKFTGRLADEGSAPAQNFFQYKGNLVWTSCTEGGFNRDNYAATFVSAPGQVNLLAESANANGTAKLGGTISRTGPVSGGGGVTPPGDYGGMWSVPTESGWGLSLVQGVSPKKIPFVTLYVYSGTAPTWLVMTGGEWNAAGTGFTGDLYSTVGVDFTEPTFDPARVQINKRGTLSVQFTSATQGTLRYNLTVNGQMVIINKTISKLEF
jgi:hypothetical protein